MAACALLTGALTIATSRSAHAEDPNKTGPIQANLKLGPAFGLGAASFTQFTLQPDLGYAFIFEKAFSVYGVFTPGFGFGGPGVVINLPVGAQVDVAIPGIDGLYAVPRFLLGPSFWTGTGGGAAFTLIPELGAKYVIEKQFNVGVDIVSIPIYIRSGGFQQYRLNFMGGANF